MLFSTLIALLTSSMVWAEGPRIEIKPYSKVTAETITLGDVAKFVDMSASEVEKFSALVLGNAPSVGEKRTFTDRAISEIFRRQLNNGKSTVGLKIPREIIVENRGYELSEENVRTLLTKQWQKLCEACRFVIGQVGLPLIPTEFAQYQWRLTEPTQLPRGTFSAQMEVLIPERPSAIFWVNGKVQVQRKVPVATRALTMGTRLTPEDVREEFKDTTFAQDTTPEVQEMIGKQIRQAIRAGDIIWQQNIFREPALRRGESVKANVGGEAFQVSLMAIAEQDGFVGDRVKLRNRESNKVLFGRVVEKGEVRIE